MEIAANDERGTAGDAAEIAAAARSIGAFALAPGGKDAALLRALPPGAFTAHRSGPPGASGIALVEVDQMP